MRRRLVLLAIVGSLLPSAHPQALKDNLRKVNIFRGAPQVTIVVDHPPQLGLSVDKVVFALPEQECEESLVDALLADFVGSGVTVTDRSNIDDLLSEHEFSASGLVNPSDVLELGRMSGADALVIARVRRCAAEHLPMESKTHRFRDGSSATTYTAVTTGSLRGTVEVVNLTTAKVVAAQNIEKDARLVNSETNSRPAYPAKHSALDKTLRDAVSTVHRLFFPWQETQTLNYYDENRCDLKIAYRLLQAGDIAGAFEQSKLNVESCTSFRSNKPQLYAKALFNLGVTELLLGRYDEAENTLEESLRLDPNKVTSATMAEVHRLRNVAQELLASTDLGPESPREEAVSDGTTKKLDDLIELYEKDLISRELLVEQASELPSPTGDMETQLTHLKKLFDFEVIDQQEYERRMRNTLQGES